MTLRIVLNGNEIEVRAERLDLVLEEAGFAGAVVATALNEEFVPRDARRATPLTDGDRLEVVAPLQGG